MAKSGGVDRVGVGARLTAKSGSIDLAQHFIVIWLRFGFCYEEAGCDWESIYRAIN